MHIRQRPNGHYEAIVQHAGTRRKVVAPTRAEALRRGSELLISLGGAPPATMTVAELLVTWADRANHSPTYTADVQRIIGRLPAPFTARPVTDVTPLIIDHLYRQMTRDGWTAHRVRRAHQVLSAAWSLANRWEITDRQPFRSTPPPTPPRRADTTPTAEQVTALLDQIGGPLWLFVTLAAITGARRGELVALQWADIGDDTIRVGRTVTYTPASGLVVGGGKIGTKGHRVVAVDAELVAQLRTHRARQATMALAAGITPLWVFSHDAGRTPWRPDYATAEYAKLRLAAGVPATVRLHDLRHFVATQLLAAGVPLRTVSGRLGHTQTATTADRYGHVLPAADREAATVIGRVLGRGTA